MEFINKQIIEVAQQCVDAFSKTTFQFCANRKQSVLRGKKHHKALKVKSEHAAPHAVMFASLPQRCLERVDRPREDQSSLSAALLWLEVPLEQTT